MTVTPRLTWWRYAPVVSWCVYRVGSLLLLASFCTEAEARRFAARGSE